MPRPVSNSSKGPGPFTPYVPSWCYKDNNPPMCSCKHHHGYHNDAGVCLQARKCGCQKYDGKAPEGE